MRRRLGVHFPLLRPPHRSLWRRPSPTRRFHPMPVTWDGLVTLEPRLADLLAEAETFTVEDDAYNCQMLAFSHGYPGPARFKGRLDRLVGWNREDGDGSSGLDSSEAWRL